MFDVEIFMAICSRSHLSVFSLFPFPLALVVSFVRVHFISLDISFINEIISYPKKYFWLVGSRT